MKYLIIKAKWYKTVLTCLEGKLMKMRGDGTAKWRANTSSRRDRTALWVPNFSSGWDGKFLLGRFSRRDRTVINRTIFHDGTGPWIWDHVCLCQTCLVQYTKVCFSAVLMRPNIMENIWAIISGDCFHGFEVPKKTPIRNVGSSLRLLTFGNWFHDELVGLVLPFAYIVDIRHVRCRRQR